MFVYNATQEEIVVRAFAAGVMVEFNQMAIIPSGRMCSVLVPNVSSMKASVSEVLVRDWACPSIDVTTLDTTMPLLRLWPSSVLIYKVPYAGDERILEGFLVTFSRLREQIRFWPTEQVGA